MEQAKMEVDQRIFETIAQYREGAINRPKALELMQPQVNKILAEVLEHGLVTAFFDNEWHVSGVGFIPPKPDTAEDRVVGTDSRDS